MICTAPRTQHEQCVLEALKAIDVRLRNSIEYEVAAIQSRADDGARNSARRSLVNNCADVLQSSHMITTFVNVSDVLVERHAAVYGYAEYSLVRSYGIMCHYFRHPDGAKFDQLGLVVVCP